MHSNKRQSRNIDDIGSAHTDAELAALKAEAVRRLQCDQLTLALALGDAEVPTTRGTGTAGQPWEITAQRSGYPLDAIGLDNAAGGYDVFAGLVTSRLLQPGSKYGSTQVLTEAGERSASYSTYKCRLARCVTGEYRGSTTSFCADYAGIGPVSLVLSAVTTLYYEANEGDGFREPGFSKERRIDP